MENLVKLPDGLPSFTHIYQNDFLGRKPKKLKDDDIAICNCKYVANEPESACGERCLNVLTSTECTLGYCPCNDLCKNQKFQKCEYAKTKLFQTEGRGWGLLADENIKAGHFIIEYCGEVISLQEAKQRSQTYEAKGLKDTYIISLNSNNFIDATKKGSLARFINHSCLPNCETRKWNILGETRVGIFAKVDISAGTELTYNYNFEWYGGANVRCLCGSANCCKFLGARSQGFQEYNHVWVEGDDRYKVEEVPLYDSAEDEHFQPFQQIPETINPFKFESTGGVETVYSQKMEGDEVSGKKLNSFDNVKPGSSVPMEGITLEEERVEGLHKQGIEEGLNQTTETIPRLRSNSAGRNFNIGAGPSKTKSQQKPKQKKKSSSGKQYDTKNIPELFQSQEAREEVRKYEELRNQATANLNAVYDEIRPVIEQHERDNQDSVPINVGQKWIGAQCNKYRADVNFSFSILKNFFDAAQNAAGAGMHAQNVAATGMRAQSAAAGGIRVQNTAAGGVRAQNAAVAGGGGGMHAQNAAGAGGGGMHAQNAPAAEFHAQNAVAGMQSQIAPATATGGMLVQNAAAGLLAQNAAAGMHSQIAASVGGGTGLGMPIQSAAGVPGMHVRNAAGVPGMPAQNAGVPGMPVQNAAGVPGIPAQNAVVPGMPAQNAAVVPGIPSQNAGVPGMPAQNIGAGMEASGSGHL